MRSSLIAALMILAASISFAQPVAVQGIIEDDRFLAICEDAAALAGFKFETGTFDSPKTVWFAYQGADGLELLINTPLAEREKKLINDRGIGEAWTIYFVGGSKEKKNSWLVADTVQYTWIWFGEKTELKEALSILAEAGVK
ncbi:MAG: hypothetical protein WCV68_03960 [Candidatus Paceibacterota bacterium]|jgi:hypothetical protein